MAHHFRDILQGFWRDPERQRCLRLAALWASWRDIVGDELAELAKPLGHSRTTLLLGVEDPMVMQEMHFHAPEILKAVNASLGEVFFDNVRLDLLGGRSSLDVLARSPVEGRQAVPRQLPQVAMGADIQPEELGQDARDFSNIPAIERCYRAYARFLKQGTSAVKAKQQFNVDRAGKSDRSNAI
jgi:hypothetical protein